MMDKTIQSIIRAFLLDYPRRNTIAAEVGTIDNKNDRASISAFMAWNERIDKALTIIDEPLREFAPPFTLSDCVEISAAPALFRLITKIRDLRRNNTMDG